MDTEEMTRRGVEDAEHGDLNPFYYQHYYHYRRSFDRTRRRQQSQALRARMGVIAAAVVALLGVGMLIFLRPSVQPEETQTAQLSMVTVVVTVTPKPIFPTPTIAPTIAPPDELIGLQTDGFAVVSNTGGRSLRARSEPNLQAQVQTTFREGERVRVVEGPIDADGLRWWRVEGEQGSGWSAELSPDGETWLAPTT